MLLYTFKAGFRCKYTGEPKPLGQLDKACFGFSPFYVEKLMDKEDFKSSCDTNDGWSPWQVDLHRGRPQQYFGRQHNSKSEKKNNKFENIQNNGVSGDPLVEAQWIKVFEEERFMILIRLIDTKKC